MDLANNADKGRREFITRVGGWFLGFSIVGFVGGLPLTAGAADPSLACSQPPTGPTDAACGSGTADAGCGLTAHPTPADPIGSVYDQDQNCSKSGGNVVDADQACGDCDDYHDEDEACGAVTGGAREVDELCGHVHGVGTYHADQVCGKAVVGGGGTEADLGCGVQGPSYGPVGGRTDPDNNCDGTLFEGSTDVDDNCSQKSSDANCGKYPPAYAGDPDEKCGATDTDEGCGKTGTQGASKAYDKDESCHYGAVQTDEACGASAVAWFDPDGNCGTEHDHDESCGMTSGSYPTGDENCHYQNERDEGCYYYSGISTYWDPDENCGTTLPDGSTDTDEACASPDDTDGP